MFHLEAQKVYINLCKKFDVQEDKNFLEDVKKRLDEVYVARAVCCLFSHIEDQTSEEMRTGIQNEVRRLRQHSIDEHKALPKGLLQVMHEVLRNKVAKKTGKWSKAS